MSYSRRHRREQLKNGNCNICNKNNIKLTFEHWPPRSCYNNSDILIQSYNDVIKGTGTISKKGFGKNTLCRECNGYTGQYVSEFKKFINQGYYFISNNNLISRYIYDLKYIDISPLIILKCIISGFFSTDYLLKSDKILSNFILNKECKEISDNYRFYIFYHSKKTGRHNGYALLRDLDGSFKSCREISFLPFGYFMTQHGENCPINTNMCEITFFKNYDYNQKDSIDLNMPYLEMIEETNNDKITSILSCMYKP